MDKAQFILDVFFVLDNRVYKHEWSDDYMKSIDTEIDAIKAEYEELRVKSFELASNTSRKNFLNRVINKI